MTEQPIASPLSLLNEWNDRADGADLHEVLLLGFSVDLPFLEKVAISTARALGARITVVGDAAQARYDPVDVRMAGRAYLHGFASCQGAFHPKLALLIGENEVVAAVGSGNPTMAGWGYNEELWTVLRGDRGAAPAGFGQLAAWLRHLPERTAVADYIGDLLRENADQLAALCPDANAADEVELLHNLDTSLLEQLPAGPVDELCLYAPFIDPTGTALTRIIEHFAPARTVIGVQERWTSYDGDALLNAIGGYDTELRLLPEQHPRHGKLLEWSVAARRRALTGSANLTASALLRPTSRGGNCELAVLAPSETAVMPDGAISSTGDLQGRRTVRPPESRPALSVLGAVLTSHGLKVTLARAHVAATTVETSPDGSPGSWTPIGTIPAGETTRVFAVPESAGSVVRAITLAADHGRTESPPAFAVHPGRCAARRTAEDTGPRLRRDYTEEEIFSDEEIARRFRYDMIRLTEQLAQHRTTKAAARPKQPAASSAIQDHWAAYLEQCERTIGRPLTEKLFGNSMMKIAEPSTSAWGLDTAITFEDGSEDPAGDEESGSVDAVENASSRVPPEARAEWRHWARRAVHAVAPAGRGPAAPLALRILIARLFILLLGQRVWEAGDDSWREDLAQLTRGLASNAGDDVPGEALQHATALAAVCMGLLRSQASLTGGAPADILASGTWEQVKHVVGKADSALAEDLLRWMAPSHAHALSRSELASTIREAADDDALVHVRKELAEAGRELDYADGLYRVTGSFTNPVPVAARVATLIGAHRDVVLVHARGGNGCWAFIAWRRPDLVLARRPGNTWRYYSLPKMATPQSRLAGGEGITKVGLVGVPVPLGKVPPEPVQRLLEEAGTDHVTLLQKLATE
ncbi:hypothetical protein GCM10027570_37410 [Streptomonospora sediminis]